VKDMMIEILFIYSKENTEVSYKQGMHELLAPVIYMLDQEKMTVSDGSILSLLMDANHLEHDAYIIFEKLMKNTGCWFISKMTNGKDKKAEKESPILQKCQHIYHKILKSKDPGLYSYISSLKIEPQLFLLRWIRLLFGREFRLDETLTLWDAIFAFDKNFSLIDYIAVSMLITIKEQLLSADQNGVLQLLFKYPTLVPMCSFVDHAISMAKSKSKIRNQLNNTQATTTNPPRNGNGAPSPHQHRLGINFQKLTTTLHHITPTPAPPSPNPSEQELQQLKLLHANVANRLENIVYLFQTNLLPVANKLPQSDAIMMALAELKQIKDVMSGHLPVEVFPLSQSPRK